ncbi:MAG: preprotein translocase subunit SecE [Pseudomonadaceae bacterium]|nr:preprotein translocase subunit SecE [Pseudomonadaceae bacterium]
MSTNTESTASGSLDWLKWLVVAALLGGGVYGNWYYQDESLLIRVAALLAGAAVAVFIAIQTERGRNTWNLMKEARSEIRRVVWPSNQETTQTTLVVLVLVLIFALILWGLDSLLSWFVSSVIG